MRLFDTSGFVPRWSCGDWDGGLGWVSVTSHAVTALVYLLIPLLLVLAATKRTDLPYRAQTYLFAAFIFCCSLGHAFNVVVFWSPVYRLMVAWDVVTAVVSVFAFVRLVPAIPHVIAMRTAEEWESKIAVLTKTERDLRHANRDLANTIGVKKELEKRIRDLEECHRTDADGITPTQAAIARMNEATRVVAQAMPAPPETERAK